MAITASQVKELREISGAGMMDCKKALSNTDGDMEKAAEWLRENGLSKAIKKAGRIAAEGIVAVDVDADGKIASIVEVNSETDFVAKNEKFQEYVAEVAAQVKTSGAADIEAFIAEPWAADTSMTVDDKLKSMVAVIGENMNIRRFERISTDGIIVPYIHAGGKIGVLVEAGTDSASDGVKECLKNIAMQIAALNPKYLSSDDVDEEYKEHEKGILLTQAKNDPKNEGKPDDIIEKMITGRLAKELKKAPQIIANEIKEKIYSFENTDTDIVITELGGTIGDMEGQALVEAIRQVGIEKEIDDVCYIHVTLLPYISWSKEIKSKPTQHSVKELQSFGIKPDILVARA